MHGRTPSDERGATAIIFAVTAVLLLSLGALAVDLGNAFVRKRDVQSQADFAALAAVAGLPTVSLTPSSSHPVISAVASYLFENQPQDDECSGPCRTKAQLRQDLTDSSASNGEVYYGSWNSSGVFVPSTYRITVHTPPTMVKFGLAAVMGIDSTTVRAQATVAMGTPGSSAGLPFYAVANGCDYGSRLLSQPANGHLDTVAPPNPMQQPLTDGSNENQSMTLDGYPTPGVVDIGAAGVRISIQGSKLAPVSRIAFLRGAGDSPNVFEVTSGFSTSNSEITNIEIPAAMTAQAGLWWIRVFKPTTATGTGAEKKDGWSRLTQPSGKRNVFPVQVGQDVFSCDGADDGNFGSLKLPRTDVSNSSSNGWLPNNIAAGLQQPLSLAVLPGATALSPYCTPGAPAVKYSTTTGTPTLVAGTNCAGTDTGLTANAATSGLVTGTSTFPARLAKDTTTGVLTSAGRNGNCGPGKSAARRDAFGHMINNDTLSCFLINPSATVGTIATPGYAGGPALDPAIYSSPRFCYVPVFGIKPSHGGSQNYGIVDVRPCFITGESTSSTYTTQSFLDGTENGVNVTGNRVTSIRVVFFSSRALPPTGPVGDYIGTGPKAVALVD